MEVRPGDGNGQSARSSSVLFHGRFVGRDQTSRRTVFLTTQRSRHCRPFPPIALLILIGLLEARDCEPLRWATARAAPWRNYLPALKGGGLNVLRPSSPMIMPAVPRPERAVTTTFSGTPLEYRPREHATIA